MKRRHDRHIDIKVQHIYKTRLPTLLLIGSYDELLTCCSSFGGFSYI